MVANIGRSWHRTQGADGRPLHIRHGELVDLLVKAGGNGIFPVSENSVDAMHAELAQRKKPEVWDERFEGARVAFEDEIARHLRTRLEIIKEQRDFEYFQQYDEHRIMAHITPAMMAKPEETAACVDRLWPRVPRRDSWRPLLPGEVGKPEFSSAEQYREARARMLVEVERLLDVKAAMAAVAGYTALPMLKDRPLG